MSNQTHIEVETEICLPVRLEGGRDSEGNMVIRRIVLMGGFTVHLDESPHGRYAYLNEGDELIHTSLPHRETESLLASLERKEEKEARQ